MVTLDISAKKLLQVLLQPNEKALRLGSKCLILSDPAEARTQDPQIKSLLLYQLSYGVKVEFKYRQ